MAADKAAGVELKPAQCRAHMKQKLAAAFPDIVKGFIKQAKLGGCQHLKLASELVTAKSSRRTKQEKGAAQKFVQEWLR